MISIRSFGFGVPEKSKSAANFFITNKLRGPIYNDYNTGSYFAYRFYPKEKVFVDGRPEAFPETFFHDVYLPMETDATAFAKALKTYQFKTIIISDSEQVPVTHEIVRALKAHREYELVYEDNGHLIFVKKIIKP
jgi:phosphoserine phosphatase